MDTQNLKTFILLSDLKNFTQTAERQYVAQSTVTNRIAELEKEIGKKLFVRDNKAVSLTEEGLVFLKYAKRIVELEESSVQEINSLKKYDRVLRIGTTNIIYECHLFSNISKFMENSNETSVKISIGSSVELIDMLKDGILDIVYTFIPFSKKGYKCSHYASDKLLLVTNPSNYAYPLGIKKEELTKINYLFCNFPMEEEGVSVKELFPKFYQFPFEINNSSKVIKYIINGTGYSFLPESIVKAYIKAGSLTVIKTLDFIAPKMNYYCSHKKDFKVIEEFNYKSMEVI
ncbi:MAG: LysR family transcriptional regulator [Solirubrobacterales bacterium]